MSTDERLLRLENAFSTLVELSRTQSERMDEYDRRTEETREMQRQTEANLAALSQIVADLGQAQRRAEERQAQMDERLDRLAALVEQHVTEGHH